MITSGTGPGSLQMKKRPDFFTPVQSPGTGTKGTDGENNLFLRAAANESKGMFIFPGKLLFCPSAFVCYFYSKSFMDCFTSGVAFFKC